MPGTDSQSSSKAILVQSFREMERERKREDTEGEGAAEAEERGRQRRREKGGRLRRREKGWRERDRGESERYCAVYLTKGLGDDVLFLFHLFLISFASLVALLLHTVQQRTLKVSTNVNIKMLPETY